MSHAHNPRTHQHEDQPFKVKLYGKSELAMLYFPYLSNPSAACRAFLRLLKSDPAFYASLKESGYETMRILSPKLVARIVENIGEP